MVALLAIAALASGARSDSALERRLDPETLPRVNQIVQAARAEGLPTAPLIGTALEGASKHAPGPRIVAAVRRHADALAAAAHALGPGSSEDEVVAGAGALLAGVPADSLSSLRASRPRRSLVIPLVVLADLVARRVPMGVASGAVLAASRAGVRDPDLLKLRERVEHDIRAGAPPAEAAALRVRALIGRAPAFGPSGEPRSSRPGREHSP